MADVKWIKIVTDVFDDEKILMIESLPEADSIIVIWFKLLCLAGKQNNSGVFILGRMPYTDEMFATVFRRPINTVRLALNTFAEFGMIEIINDTVTIPNWDKHQHLDAYEKKKERDRVYQAERRAAQKQIAEKSSDKSPDVALQIRKEEDKKRYTTPPIVPPTGTSAEVPSVETVENFCREKNIQTDAREFHRHYTALDWKIRGEAVQDWRALLLAWAKKHPKNGICTTATDDDPSATRGASFHLGAFMAAALKRSYGGEDE